MLFPGAGYPGLYFPLLIGTIQTIYLMDDQLVAPIVFGDGWADPIVFRDDQLVP